MFVVLASSFNILRHLLYNLDNNYIEIENHVLFELFLSLSFFFFILFSPLFFALALYSS